MVAHKPKSWDAWSYMDLLYVSSGTYRAIDGLVARRSNKRHGRSHWDGRADGNRRFVGNWSLLDASFYAKYLKEGQGHRTNPKPESSPCLLWKLRHRFDFDPTEERPFTSKAESVCLCTYTCLTVCLFMRVCTMKDELETSGVIFLQMCPNFETRAF